MKLVKWQFQSLVVPMVEIDGDLYCTSKTIQALLEFNLSNFKRCCKQHEDWIGAPLSSQTDTLRKFLKDHKQELNICRVRDIDLWSDYQMFTFAKFSKSSKAMIFHKELWDFVKQHARASYISVEQYKELEERMESKLEFAMHRIERLEQEREAIRTPMSQIASGAGTILNLQKKTKPYRTNKTIVGA